MYKTAEAVTCRHPDKMADQISDAILDYCLTQDPMARVAVEVFGCHGKVMIGGEVTFNGEIKRNDVFDIVERITGKKDLKDIEIRIVKQSPEIANGVDAGGAGDQGIMIGYACNSNERMIPQEKYLADSLCEFIYEKYPYDGKTQITLNDNNEIIVALASFQNVSGLVLKELIDQWGVGKNMITDCLYLTNPAGDWSIGGFDADTGLTGRKLMVDNYGPQIPIGGGAFSGKDATKVDRSAAYMARKMAVEFLKQSNAKEVIVKLAYAIGVAKPVMISIVVDGVMIRDGVAEANWDLTPKGIIEFLKLREPQFEATARGGHFGKGFIWDK